MPIDSLDEEGLSLKELLKKYNEQGKILFPILSLFKSCQNMLIIRRLEIHCI